MIMQSEFHAVTQVDIFKMLCSSRKAFGYYGQPPNLLKLSAPILSFTLLPILNNSMEHNVFLNNLKYVEVSPLSKEMIR